MLGASVINETRFQFYRANISSISDDSGPKINVLNAFVGGGAQVGNSLNTLDTYELQNYTTISHKSHTVRFGVRSRAATLDNYSPINFGGTFTFGGLTAPQLNAANQPVIDVSGQPVLIKIDSIENYRRTLLFSQLGLSPGQSRALGGGASQFTINAGRAALGVHQEDFGVFIGDDWRARSNLTINVGIRYEWQTNLQDWRNLAPRIGVAWASSFRRTGRTTKTVFRAGFGMFYQRFDLTDLLTAQRYNGSVQRQYVVINPDFFPSIPPISSLSQTQQVTEQLSKNLRAPYVMESAISVERQLPGHTTVALTYVNSHGLHQFFTSGINTPLPGTYNPQVPGSEAFRWKAPINSSLSNRQVFTTRIS